VPDQRQLPVAIRASHDGYSEEQGDDDRHKQRRIALPCDRQSHDGNLLLGDLGGESQPGAVFAVNGFGGFCPCAL